VLQHRKGYLLHRSNNGKKIGLSYIPVHLYA
jgi:hypothetical protein